MLPRTRAPDAIRSTETTRIHHAARRRRGGVAAYGAGAAAGEVADYRVLGLGHAFIAEPVARRFCAAVAPARLDRRSHYRDRGSLGGGTPRAIRRDRGRLRQAQGRCYRYAG